MKLICSIIFFSLIFAFAREVNLDDFEAEYKNYKDPLFIYNRTMTHFNMNLYYGLRPILKAYNAITPAFIRIGTRNFFDNLFGPLRFISNVLQFKFQESDQELKRFSVNTIMGFGGMIDLASKMGLKKYPADLGIVLAHWGVGSGFHIVLPVLGPSNLRDMLSLPGIWYANAITYIVPTWTNIGISAYNFTNELSFKLNEMDAIYHNSINIYPFLRDAYEQRRRELSK